MKRLSARVREANGRCLVSTPLRTLNLRDGKGSSCPKADRVIGLKNRPSWVGLALRDLPSLKHRWLDSGPGI